MGSQRPAWSRPLSRPAEAFQPNSPSCGNQPAHISLTARRKTRPPKTDKAPRNKGDGPRTPVRRPSSHACLTRPTYISVGFLGWVHGLPQPRSHRHDGQPALPRRDDVRPVGRARPRESTAIIHAALDAGINFVDTADVYSRGESEEIVGEALAGGRRDDVILATKFHGPMDVGMGQPGGDPNQRGNSRRWIVRRSRTACAGCRPTGSTSTRCTGPSARPTSRRPCPR